MRVVLFTLCIGLLASVTQAKEDILTTAARAGSFKTLVSYVIAADLDTALQGKGHFTVFAPTDEAFSKLPEETRRELLSPEGQEKLAEILKYHVLKRSVSIPKNAPSHPLKKATTLAGKRINFTRDDEGVLVNDSRVIQRNITCSNGIIHVIDEVLVPPVVYVNGGILDVAQKAGNFKTLLTAIRAAGLEEALNSNSEITVFAPTDEAFAALPEGTLESLLEPASIGQLTAILKLHVVPGAIEASELLKAGATKTLSGEQVAATIEKGRVQINGANVLSNDIRTSNGIIHAIDSVLLPNTETESEADDRKQEVRINADWRTPVKRDGIAAKRVVVRVSGGGSVTLTNLNAEEVIANLSGGARIALDGSADRLEASIAGGARLEAAEMQTRTTKATVYGGAVAGLNATEQLDVTVYAGARVKYVPTGAKITKSVNKYASFEPYSEEMTTKLTAKSAAPSSKSHH
jgi:transforming growth factor-beta-induced protein